MDESIQGPLSSVNLCPVSCWCWENKNKTASQQCLQTSQPHYSKEQVPTPSHLLLNNAFLHARLEEHLPLSPHKGGWWIWSWPPSGYYEHLVMPFGLTNAPHVFHPWYIMFGDILKRCLSTWRTFTCLRSLVSQQFSLRTLPVTGRCIPVLSSLRNLPLMKGTMKTELLTAKLVLEK